MNMKKLFSAFLALLTLSLLTALVLCTPLMGSAAAEAGVATVTLQGWTYGETPNTPVTSGFPEGDITFTYYTNNDLTDKTTAADGAATEGGRPTYAGTYALCARLGDLDPSCTFTISPAKPTAALFTVSKPQNLVFDGESKEIEVKLAEGVAGLVDFWAEILDREGGGIEAPTLVSDYTVSIHVQEARNYESTPEGAPLADSSWNFTISPKQIALTGLSVKDKEYDGATSAELSGEAKIDPSTLVGEYTDVTVAKTGTAAFADANAGESKTVVLTGFELGGEFKACYTLGTPTLTGKITPKKASVTAADQEIFVGETIAESTDKATLAGALSGHTLSAVKLTPSDTSAPTDAGTITPSGAKIADAAGGDATANYTISYTPGKLTVKAKPAVFTVSFDPNGGTGTMQALQVTEGQTVKIPNNAFTYEGHTFNGWNTAADGTGTAYESGDSLTPAASLTLYAMWTDINPTVTLSSTDIKLHVDPVTVSVTAYSIAGDRIKSVAVSHIDNLSASFQGNVITILPRKKISRAWVTVTTLRGAQATIKVKVKKAKMPGLSFSTKKLTITGLNNPGTITANLGQGDAISEITLTKPEVASVSFKGSKITLTGMKFGSTSVMVYTEKGCAGKFTVKFNKTKLKLNVKGTLKIIGMGSTSIGVAEYGLEGDYLESVSSTDETIATAKISNGKIVVTAVAPDTPDKKDGWQLIEKGGKKATIQVTTHYGATAKFKVQIVQEMKLSESKLSFTKSMSPVAVTIKAGGPAVRAATANADVATAETDGNTITVTPHGSGVTEISIISKSGALAILKVTVKPVSSGILLNKSDVSISDLTRAKNIYVKRGTVASVSSDDKTVATAKFENGKIAITGIGQGKTVVRVTDEDGSTACVNVTVKGSSFKLKKTSLSFSGPGVQEVQVKSYAYGDSGMERIESTNENVVTAEIQGNTVVVTAHRQGTAFIVVYTKHNVFRIKIKVK